MAWVFLPVQAYFKARIVSHKPNTLHNSLEKIYSTFMLHLFSVALGLPEFIVVEKKPGCSADWPRLSP